MPIVMLRKKSDKYDKELQHRNKIHESFEEIANTYLKTSTTSLNGKTVPKKKAVSVKIPWIIAAIAVTAALFIFISNSSFDVRIRVLNKAPLVRSANVSELSSGLSGNETMLVRGGEVVSNIVARAAFIGDAVSASKASRGEILLSNSGGSGSASYKIEFKKPLDLSRYEIGYFAKAVTDGSRLVLVITDSDNKAYRVEDNQISRPSKEWRAYWVDLKPLKGALDLKNVANIRFEFGSSTAGNPSDTALSVKDVYLAKSQRVKWL